jgi:AcrR family transcriptional regulator
MSHAPPFTSAEALATGLLQRGRTPLVGADLRPSQRLRLLRGMVEACSSKGYATATVADVVRAARVSRQTFYEQFDSKEACFLAAQDLGHRLIQAQVVQAAGGERWDDDLANVFRAYFALLAAEPELAHATLVEALGAGQAALARRARALVRHAELLEQLQETGRAEDPDLPALDRDLSLAIIGGINELALAYLRAGQAERLTQLDRKAYEFARAVMRTGVAQSSEV